MVTAGGRRVRGLLDMESAVGEKMHVGSVVSKLKAVCRHRHLSEQRRSLLHRRVPEATPIKDPGLLLRRWEGSSAPT